MTSDPDELLLDSLTSSSLKKMNEVVKRKESFSRVGRTRDKQKKKLYKPKHAHRLSCHPNGT